MDDTNLQGAGQKVSTTLSPSIPLSLLSSFSLSLSLFLSLTHSLTHSLSHSLRYKKNLKKLYVVHPTNFIRVVMILFKPFISYKFGRKVTYINRLDELKPVLYLDQIDIPTEVKK